MEFLSLRAGRSGIKRRNDSKPATNLSVNAFQLQDNVSGNGPVLVLFRSFCNKITLLKFNV